MMFIATLFTLFFAALSVLAAPSATATVSYDQTFDNASGDLETVACSDGPNGLIPKGLPSSPHNASRHSPSLRFHDLRFAPALPLHWWCRRRRGLELAELRVLLDAVVQRQEH